MAVGATIRAIGHRWRPVLAVPARSFSRHSVIIGSSGSGKTNLMMRLWAGWYAATHAEFIRREGDRPLLIVLDCKGGPDARVKAERTRRLLHGVGARRVAIWPDEARLCLWDLPPRDLGVLLLQMIETGDGAAAFYADIMQTVLNLALAAPGGPPGDAASFLDRLDFGLAGKAYGDGAHEAAMIRIRAARPHLGDIQLRCATLLGRLGPALDGPGTLAGADVWYCILEGTREQSVAETQAMALTELVAHAATDPERNGGRSCSPPTTTPPSPAEYRSPTCMSGAGPSASASRSRPSPGKDSAPTTMSGTGSPPPPMAGSGCCTPLTPNR